MATAINNLTQYYIEGAFSAFTDVLAPINAFMYHVSPVGAGLNDVVRVPFVSNVTASNDFAYSTGYATSGDTVTGKNVTLSGLKYKLMDITDQDAVRLSQEVQRRLGAGAGAQLAADVLANVWLNVTSSVFSQKSNYSASAFTASAPIANLQQLADTSKWTSAPRSLIVGPALYANLVQNNVTIASSFGSPSVIQTGRFGQNFYGFTPYLVTNLPTNSDTLQGFACNPNALLFANAYHQPQDAIPYLQKVQYTDPQTGITVGVRVWYDFVKAKVQTAMDCLWGAAVGDPTALYRICTTPT